MKPFKIGSICAFLLLSSLNPSSAQSTNILESGDTRPYKREGYSLVGNLTRRTDQSFFSIGDFDVGAKKYHKTPIAKEDIVLRVYEDMDSKRKDLNSSLKGHVSEMFWMIDEQYRPKVTVDIGRVNIGLFHKKINYEPIGDFDFDVGAKWGYDRGGKLEIRFKKKF